MKTRSRMPSWVNRAAVVGGLVVVISVVALQRRSQTRLEEENAVLRQRIEQSETRWNENAPLAAARQQFFASEAGALGEINRLRNEVSQLRERTNQLMTLRRAHAAEEAALGRERWQTEYFRLKDEFTGKPRVPRVGAWLGVGIGNIGESDRTVSRTEGAIVRMLVPNGPAAVAKIQPGDVIVSVDDTAVRDSEEFKALLAQKNGAQTVKLGVVREGEQLVIDVKAHDWPQ